jgi:phage terminase large subunit-like protein
VVVEEDRNQNIFPRKQAVHLKIDGAVALIMALGRLILGNDERQIVPADYELVAL